eukprot:3449008-Pleurochrysis_carterae.AAC.1
MPDFDPNHLAHQQPHVSKELPGCRASQTMLSLPLTVAITRAGVGWRSKDDLVQIDVRTSLVGTLKKVRKCTSWMPRLPLPDPRP